MKIIIVQQLASPMRNAVVLCLASPIPIAYCLFKSIVMDILLPNISLSNNAAEVFSRFA